jgi:flagellin
MSLFSVNTNLGALAALQSLDTTQQQLSDAQNQVSTGKKVGSSSDNPAIYSISNTINSNIAGLSAVSDSLNFGAQIVGTANSAVSNISSVLANLQQTVTSSGQSGLDLTTLQNLVTTDLAQINQYASQSTFTGVNLLDPTVGAGNSGALSVVQGLDGSVYTIGNQGLALNASATTFTQALGISNLNVTNPGYQASFNQNLSVASFSSTPTGSTLTSPANASFQITTGTGATAKTFAFEFTDNAAATTPQLQTAQATNTNIVDVQINTSTQSTNQIVGALVNAVRSSGFSVSQNTDGSLNITGSDSTGQTISNVQFGSVSAGTFAANTGVGVTIAANTASTTAANVSTVQAAVTAANNIAATLGAASQQITGIQNFTSSLSSALTAGVGALTDADLAAESARLTSLQTKQQLATQSLSIANKQPQSLLSLFQGL